MVGKIISKAARSEETALLKISQQEQAEGEEGAGEVSAFKSLLDSLQGGHPGVSENEDGFSAGEMLSDDRLASLAKENGADQLHQQAENIFRILSDGSLEDEDLKLQLRQLLNQLKQEGRGQQALQQKAESVEEVQGRGREKVQVDKVISEIQGLLSDQLSDDEMERLAKAADSGQISKTFGEIARLFSGGIPEDGDRKTPLKHLLGQLRQEDRRQTPLFRGALGEGSGQEKNRQGDVVIQEMSQLLSGHLSEEEMGKLTKAVESGKTSKASAEITRLLSEGNLEDGESKAQLRKLLEKLNKTGGGGRQTARLQESEVANEKVPTEDGKEIKNGDREMVDGGKNPEATSGRGNKDRPLNRLEQRIAGNAGSDSTKKSDGDLSSDAGRQEKRIIAGKQKELVDSFFLKGVSGSAAEQGLGGMSGQLEKSLKKEGRDMPGRGADPGEGREPGRERSSFFGLSSLSGRVNGDQSLSSGSGILDGSTGSSEFSADEQEIMWKEYTTGSGETQEEKEAMQQSPASSTLKLGQIPIANGALRTKILPALTQNILKAASEAKKNPEQWQKHNFILDDGKEMQLSVREAKGVLQVKMGSMNLDLSKLLQQHLQQIREHLKQEFGTDIDLQLDNAQHEGPASHFSESSPNRGNKQQTGSGDSGVRSAEPGKAKLKAVRNFGYNQMEWTA